MKQDLLPPILGILCDKNLLRRLASGRILESDLRNRAVQSQRRTIERQRLATGLVSLNEIPGQLLMEEIASEQRPTKYWKWIG